MISIEFQGAKVSADTLKNLREVIALFPSFAETVKGLLPKQSAPSASPASGGIPARNGANVSKWMQLNGGGRFRITKEESALFGDDREAAAIARLDAMGESPANGEGTTGAQGTDHDVDPDDLGLDDEAEESAD